jgi:hypothetical protein
MESMFRKGAYYVLCVRMAPTFFALTGFFKKLFKKTESLKNKKGNFNEH